MKQYIIIVACILVGKYVDIPVWFNILFGISAYWAVDQLRRVADDKVTKDIQVCNNANDSEPAWEVYAPDSAGNHTFANNEKTADKWAVATKVEVTANNSTEEISLKSIGMGVL